MIHIIRGTADIIDGEDIFDDFPKTDDPRWSLFIAEAKKRRVMDENGNALKPCKLRRGIGPEGFLMELEWDDAPILNSSAHEKHIENQDCKNAPD